MGNTDKFEMIASVYDMSNKSTRIRFHVKANREKVYKAFIDFEAIKMWKFPDDMTCHVHSFEGYEGGSFRISLIYETPTGTGKTTENTDTYSGYFKKLVPNEQIVEVDEFETEDDELKGEMTITITLTDAGDGTDILVMHEGLPPKLSAVENEVGWRMALTKLAAFVETES